MTIIAIEQARHRNTKISGTEGHPHAAGLNLGTVVMAEIAQASLDFPIVFSKDSRTGRFICSALFGLAEAENLFHNGKAWNSTYVPMNIQRAPFIIGESGKQDGKLGPCIDESSQYLSDQGQALFDDQGNKTEYLQQAESFLATLFDYEVASQHFVNLLAELKLIAPLSLHINNTDGSKATLQGLYTINQEGLRGLADADILRLSHKGYLAPIYAIIGSLGQLRRLRNLKNQRNPGSISAVQVEIKQA